MLLKYLTFAGRLILLEMEDDLNGRQPKWKLISIEDELNGRQHSGK